MKVIICDDYQKLSEKAANYFLNQLAIKSDSVFGLATGSTPLGTYQEIIKRCQEFSYNFSQVITFNLDEYCISLKHPQGYRHYMMNNFFGKLPNKPKHIYIPTGNDSNYQKVIKEYEAKLKRYPIDFQVLGLGSNGHIAFNEPGSSIKSKTRRIALSEQTINDNSRFFNNKSEVPHYALTMGISNILRAKKIIMLANGKHKAEAVRDMIEGSINSDCPASFLQTHPDVTIIVDKEAASKLKKKYSVSKEGWFEDLILTENIVPKNKKILVVSPHHDDSAVSCGAILSCLTKYNKVTTVVMSNGSHASMKGNTPKERTASREQEAKNESRILKTKTIFNYSQFYDFGKKYWQNDLKRFAKVFKAIKPDIIILPDDRDNHPTHALSTELVLDFLKTQKKRPELWYYEGLWSQHVLEEINLIFGYNKKRLAIKNKAIRAHKSQISRLPLIGATENLARFRALTIAEQNFVSYGESPFELDDYVEAYFREKGQ